MPRPRPKPLILLVAVLTLLAVAAGGHEAATALIRLQQDKQLHEIATAALRRAEASVDFAAAGLRELGAKKPIACEAAGLQTARLSIYRRGALKDIRVTDAKGAVLCSAYPETLEFDEGWTTRDAMLPTADPAVRLFRVDQFFGTALGVFREGAEVIPKKGHAPEPGGLVAILGITGASFDVMPGELKGRSAVDLELSDGRSIARTASGLDENRADALTVSLASERMPLKAVVRVDRAALGAWSQEPYWPIMALSTALGGALAAFVLRLAGRPADPVATLDAAIEGGEFRPYLQPIFELGSENVVGAEILARQIRPSGEVLPPSRFIPLAEQSGRIGAITWRILRQALEEAKPLLSRDPAFKVSVNVTPRHFIEPGFAEELLAVVEAAGARPEQITLELTEREAFEELDDAARLVARIRRLGFRVAIDDVGIGHSGLSQIQKLGADTLKVDKFFVDGITRDASAQVVVEMLMRLAAEMGMTVVAEGIEEEAQASALLSCGVAHGQGYLVSPPLPVADFLAFVDERLLREALAEADAPAAAAA